MKRQKVPDLFKDRKKQAAPHFFVLHCIVQYYSVLMLCIAYTVIWYVFL